MSAKVRAAVFDACGTLFDASVVLRGGSSLAGDVPALSRLWRQKQVESTWLRTLMERYEDFWDVTEAALRWAVRQLSIEVTGPQFNRRTSAESRARSAISVATPFRLI